MKYITLERERIPKKTIRIRPKDKPWFDMTFWNAGVPQGSVLGSF